MKTKIFKIAANIFGTILIIHLLGIALLIMIPKEDTLNIAKLKYYPPFVGSYVQKMENDRFNYQKDPNNTNLSVEFDLSEGAVVSAMMTNTIVMTILFFFVWLSLHSKLDNLHTEKILKE